MPITRMELANFKCFAASGVIPLAPLTLVFGRNNSGKSSILQSLLLLRQTLDSPVFGPRLNLRGPYYEGGAYVDVVHQHKAKQHVSMQFVVALPDRFESLREEADARLIGKGEGRVYTLTLEFSSDEPQPPKLTRLEVRGSVNETIGEIRRGRGAGGPYELYINGDKLGGEAKANFRFPVNRFLPLVGYEFRGGAKRQRARTVIRAVLSEFERWIEKIRAVGPFRQRPERRYDYQGRVANVPDISGEHFVDALVEDATRRKGRGELLQGVNSWLARVGRVKILPLKRMSKSSRLYEVRVRDTDSGRWANFADVGFGIGQALPLLVEGLRTPVGGTYVVQEPEIHLHPDAQLAMADFLVSLMKSGRNVIAETHSENILLRIRRLATQKGTGGIERGKVSILYVDKDLVGSSRVREIQMDQLGQLVNWPKGFMEEATDERMSLLENMADRHNARG